MKPKRKRHLPFLFLNLAISADGKIASANGAIPNFGSRRDKQHMMELRTYADAIMSGARTVDLNSVTLGPGSEKYRKMRLRRGLAEYNLRVIVSGSGSIDPTADIFRHRFSPIIILTRTRTRVGTRGAAEESSGLAAAEVPPYSDSSRASSAAKRGFPRESE